MAITHKVPPLPTKKQLEEVLQQHIKYKPAEAKVLADGVCELLQQSPLAMAVIAKYGLDVPIGKAGSIFTGGFLTGFMVAYAMMKLKEN